MILKKTFLTCLWMYACEWWFVLVRILITLSVIQNCHPWRRILQELYHAWGRPNSEWHLCRSHTAFLFSFFHTNLICILQHFISTVLLYDVVVVSLNFTWCHIWVLGLKKYCLHRPLSSTPLVVFSHIYVFQTRNMRPLLEHLANFLRPSHYLLYQLGFWW